MHSPLSVYFKGIDLSQYITHIETDGYGGGTFTGFISPELCDRLPSAGFAPPAPEVKKKKGKKDRHRWQDLIDEAAPRPVDGEQELTDWWLTRAAAEIEQTVPKAIEYGADDLVDIGREMAQTMGLDVSLTLDEDFAELGVYFYLIGKLGRWKSAIRRGEKPSDDTLFDIGVYVRMAQRIRSHGGWPGTKETK